MTQELQDDLKLVAEFDGWTVKVVNNRVHKLSPKGRSLGHAPVDWCKTLGETIKYQWKAIISHSEMTYLNWNGQIPVWSKLCKESEVFPGESAIYYQAIDDDLPAEGFKILVSIIKRIKQ